MKWRYKLSCLLVTVVLALLAIFSGFVWILGLSYYCKDDTEFIAQIHSQVENSDTDFIARELVGQWLDHFKRLSYCTDTRLLDYRIDSVTAHESLGASLQADYPDEQIYNVTYSVRPTLLSMDNWVAGNGLGPDLSGWINRKFYFVGIKSNKGNYIMRIIGTGL